MQGLSRQSVSGDIAAALAWWRDAGVDWAFANQASVWIAEPEPVVPDENADPQPMALRQARVEEAALPLIGGERDSWPQDLAGFQQWWMSEPSLDGGRLGNRVPPRGLAGAKVMVLVEQPEADDRDRLLSGPQGQLLDAMLAAMGIAPEETYVSAALGRNTPLPEWDALAAAGLGALLGHHVRLAAPQRLIAFGTGIPSLLGHDPTQSSPNLQIFNHEGATVPVLYDRSLDALTRARAKAGFWQRWLDWSGI